jgi:putative Holliday junction resolvase
MTTLGLDFGTKRIGLALARGSLVEPLFTIPNDAHTWETLAKVCVTEHVTQVVVGVSEGAMAETSQQFAAEAEVKLGLPVSVSDETLSTHEARARLAQALPNRGPRGREEVVDHYAAAVMLEEWVEDQSPSG